MTKKKPQGLRVVKEEKQQNLLFDSTITVEMELITTEIAREYLEKNTMNRPLAEKQLAKYSGDMKEDMWLETGDPIKFADTGELLDGQHRLSSIVMVNKSIWLPVVRGLKKDAFMAMDMGKKRSLSDVLHVMGVKNSVRLSVCVSVLCAYKKNTIFSVFKQRKMGSGFPLKMLLETYEKNKDIDRSYLDTQNICRRYGNKSVPTELVCFLHAARKYYPYSEHEKIFYFIKKVITGELLEEGSAILVYRNYLQQIVRCNSHISSSFKMALLIKAWNRERLKIPTKSYEDLFPTENTLEFVD